MAQRDYTLYGLQKATPVTVLSRFQLTDSGVAQIVFDTFESQAAFVANDVGPIPRLKLTFLPEPAAGAPRLPSPGNVLLFSPSDMTQFAEVLDAIREKALDILGLGGRGYTLTNFYVDTLGKVMEISAVKGGDRLTDSKSGDEYDATLAANMDLAGEALTVAWTYGKTHDSFLAAMTAV